MNSRALPNYPNPNDPLTADWGRRVVDYLRSITPISGGGTRLSRGVNGTVITSAPAGAKITESGRAIGAWAVRWRSHDKDGEDPTSGEWQVYAPRGSMVVNYGTLRTYDGVADNDDGTDADGNEEYSWYKIDGFEDADAKITRTGDYVAKVWSVRVLTKPWSIFKVSTNPKEDGYERVAWTDVIASAYEITWTDDDGNATVMHGVTQHFTGVIRKEWDVESAFAIDYELENEGERDSAYTVKLINQVQMLGRLQEENVDPVDVKGKTDIWVKILHDSEEFTMSIETDDPGPSNDDQTTVKIYEVEDDVVKTDRRSHLTALPFYTNEPDEGNEQEA